MINPLAILYISERYIGKQCEYIYNVIKDFHKKKSVTLDFLFIKE